MPNYQKMYHTLFNEITIVIEKLQTIQKETEKQYIDSDEAPISIVKNHDNH